MQRLFIQQHIKKKISYWGVDNNPELLNRKINKYSKKFKFLKTNKIPFKRNFFDCVLISHVIGHVANTETLFKNLRRVLSSNGIMILVTPNKYYKFFYFFRNIFNNYQPDETIVKYYSLTGIINLFEKNKMPNKIIINTHPQRWYDFGFSWTQELIFQNIKNMIKLLLKKQLTKL